MQKMQKIQDRNEQINTANPQLPNPSDSSNVYIGPNAIIDGGIQNDNGEIQAGSILFDGKPHNSNGRPLN